jgi:membrane protease YdiL (CAAX protease family)
VPYLVFTIIAAGTAFFYLSWKNIRPVWNKNTICYIASGLFIVSSFIQEFVFRSFLTVKLFAVYDSVIFVILMNAALFTLMHLIYSEDNSVFAPLFIVGLCFAALYVYFPNLILITLSHSVLNAMIVVHDIFSVRPRFE